MNGSVEYQDIRAKQIDAILETNRRRLNEWLERNQGARIDQVPAELYPAFLPRRVYELAANPDKVKIFQLPAENRVRFLGYEEDFSGGQLTDPNAWTGWQLAKEATRIESAHRRITVMPQPPATINHFHAKYDNEIKNGRLKFTDRVLMENHFGQDPSSPETLHVAYFDSERKQGIGKEFYQQILPNIAKQFGVRFIVGTNTETNLSFFTDPETGLGRSSINQIRPEFRNQFFPNFTVTDPCRDYSQYTVQFLYPEDKAKYLV